MFEYPINQSSIKNIKKLKKELLERDGFMDKNIAILGGSTTSRLKDVLEVFLLDKGIRPTFFESEYNKYYEDALFSEELTNFKADIIYIHTTHTNLTFPSVKDTEADIETIFSNELEKYKSIWDALQKQNCSIIQNNFDYPRHRSLGNLDTSDVHGKTHFINRMNLEFAKASREIKNLYINDINYISSYMGIENFFNTSLYYQAKYAMSFEAINEVAFNLSNIIASLFGKAKKTLVLDLDNTLWGGIIGDDGVNGIHIGSESALGEAHTALQNYAKELKDRGVMLAVASKNEEDIAKSGFGLKDSALKLDDFTAFKANWEPKSENIANIAQDINIGIDSLVFIDDNPAEREIVKTQLPDVSVPNVGDDITKYIDFIDRNGYFEPVSLSADDMKRNKYYEDNKKRDSAKAKFASYDDFLISLDMKAEVEDFNDTYMERITQLINKTNQFNLTTKRYTSKETEDVKNSSEYIAIYGRLEDKFGDNGLVAISIGKIEKDICHLELWLMSCRVLKRDMEFAMLDGIVKRAKEKGVKKLVGYYYKTPKNAMVSKLYESFGFELVKQDGDDTTWELDIESYENKNRFIDVTR